MKLWEIFRFEISYQSRRVSTWIYFAVLLLLTRYLTMEVSTEFASSERFFFHAPLIVAIVSAIASVIGLMIAAAVAGDAGARIVQTRMDPLLYTAPVSKGAHLAGRFLAAFVLQALILLAVPMAMLMVEVMPPRDAGLVGPLRPIAYLAAYALIALPNAFIATAFLFSIALFSRSSVVSYLGALVLGCAGAFSWVFVAVGQGRWDLAKLLDPLGATVLVELTMVWTAAERSMQLVGPQTSLVLNRMVWMGIALGVLALAYRRYRLDHRAPDGLPLWSRLRRRSADAAGDPRGEQRAAPIVVPRVNRTLDVAAHVRQTFEIARESFWQIVTSWGAVALATVAALALVSGFDMDFMGVPLFATTERVTDLLSIGYMSMLVSLLICFYAGELIWRERDARLSDITDAAPVPEWVSVLGKFVGLSLVVVVFQAVMMGVGFAIQAIWKQHNFEVGLYARVLFGFQLVDYLLFAVLACCLHALVNHKYVGHFLFLIAYAAMSGRRALGIESNLLVYGSDPGWDYSDMRGFAPFVAPWLWFKLYWAAWAVLLAVVIRLVWVRGRETELRARIAVARGRLTRPAVWWAVMSMVLVLGAGGFIFYNTNVVNARATNDDDMSRRAEYERQYSQYARIPQPQLTGTSLNVEIHPERREVQIRGSYRLMNVSADSIDAIHVATRAAVDTRAVRLDRPVKNVGTDERLGHRIYALESPLRRGESLRLEFEVQFKPRGFSNRPLDASVVANGTYFTNRAWLPAIGYQADRELRAAADRRTYGLAARPAVALLDDEYAGLDLERSARVEFEATVGTDQGQIAVAPGRLRRTWTENGRRYFHYVTDAPIRNDYAFYSAAYAVREGRWRPSSDAGPEVSIEVVHHPAHAWNVDRMIRSVQASLEYYTKMLGPYPHGQFRLVEHPGESVVLHAAPVNVSYSEGVAVLNPGQDAREFDLLFAVVAHEVAHQWWGNTLTPAGVEGASLLTETLAWYSAMGAVEQSLGRTHLERLLAMMREAYLIPDTRANAPLLRATDRFLAYRKGPFAMHALREYVGREPIDAAVRRLLDQHPAGALPLATSRDLYRELQAVTPEALRPLLADLFERNVYWELATERATATRTEDGAWQVTLDVRARKVAVNEEGAQTELPMDDEVEVGVFAGVEDEAPLYLQRHRVRSGEHRITVTVPRQPTRAGIDPRHLLIDVDAGDNLKPIGR